MLKSPRLHKSYKWRWNYYINDPYFEKTFTLVGKIEKKLTVLLYQVSGDVRVIGEFSNHDKGKKIKTYFRENH